MSSEFFLSSTTFSSSDSDSSDPGATAQSDAPDDQELNILGLLTMMGQLLETGAEAASPDTEETGEGVPGEAAESGGATAEEDEASPSVNLGARPKTRQNKK